MTIRTTATFLIAIGSITLGCVQPTDWPVEEDPRTSGILTLGAALEADLAFDLDVSGVAISIVPGDDCAGESVAAKTVGIDGMPMPEWLLEEGAGDSHAFAADHFVLAPGAYMVCATPLGLDGEPSDQCQPTESAVEVVAGYVVDHVVVANCTTIQNGGVGAEVVFNTAPSIYGLNATDNLFLNTCETTDIEAEIQDAEGDDFVVEWALLEAPAGANPELAGVDTDTLSFGTDMPGPYLVQVTATDVFGASHSLAVTIHAAGACCETVVVSENFEGSALTWTFEGDDEGSDDDDFECMFWGDCGDDEDIDDGVCQWQITDAGQSNSSDHALYYGNVETMDYDCGTTSGSATSSAFELETNATYRLTAMVYIDTEQVTQAWMNFYDLLTLSVPDSESYTLFEKSSATPHKEWFEVVADLTAFAGDEVSLQWHFDSVDGLFNDTEGVYVDDITVTKSCARTCDTDEDCADGFDFSTDTCIAGVCNYSL